MRFTVIRFLAAPRFLLPAVLLAATYVFVPLNICAQLAPETKEVTLTANDRKFAEEYLTETKEKFARVIGGLNQEQLNFKANDKKWSAANVAEHLIIVEKALLGLISTKLVNNPAPIGKDSFRIKDGAIIMAVTNRARKFNAPPVVQPKSRFTKKAEILKAFADARNKTVRFVNETDIDLRNHFAENPVFGVIDTYQWVIFLNAHAERHLAQIEEIKSHPGFPKS